MTKKFVKQQKKIFLSLVTKRFGTEIKSVGTGKNQESMPFIAENNFLYKLIIIDPRIFDLDAVVLTPSILLDLSESMNTQLLDIFLRRFINLYIKPVVP